MSKIPNFEKFDVNEAIVAAGFGMNNIQNFGIGGGVPQTGYSMGAIAGTVGTSADAIGNQANEYEMNENDDHTAKGYITEAKKHVNESIDKAYENCKGMNEGSAIEDAEELYKEIKKDRKTKMNSDIEDGSILFFHKDVAKGKAEINVNGYDGDITIEVPGGPYGSGEWYGEPVENMKDIDKQIKRYIKAEKDGEFDDMEESVSEAMVQVAGDKKPSGAKILAMVIVDHLIDKKIVTMAYKKKLNAEIQDLIIKSTF